MDEALLNLVQQGEITQDYAIAYAQDVPSIIKRLVALG